MGAMARILVTEEIAEGGLDRLRAAGHEVDVQLDLDSLLVNVRGAQGMIIRSATQVTAEVLAAADQLMVVGRAGMRYRDLLPGRLGGRFIASRIQIAEGGPVPDYVHFHRIRFQLITCVRGWVRVVYEDQGPPFVMNPGDCVLQPPEIRHRVLESSPGLEVIELGCPAEHATLADHELALPTATLRPEREFGGQRFVRHQAALAAWERADGREWRDTGIAAATHGLADVRIVRAHREQADVHHGELLFRAVLEGTLTLRCDGVPDEALGAGDSFVIPAASAG